LQANVFYHHSIIVNIQALTRMEWQLFPQVLPVFPGLDYARLCRAARGVGGDYYDFILLEPGKLGLALGDISGKGIAAALLMAGLQAALRSYTPIRGSQLDLLAADLNRLMCASVDGSKYATFFYCLFEEHSHQLTYVNAGHNPPLLFHSLERMEGHPEGSTLNEMALSPIEG
jgi:phosphoserine phosphatase RsbU/P